jgi:hypothetical protein
MSSDIRRSIQLQKRLKKIEQTDVSVSPKIIKKIERFRLDPEIFSPLTEDLKNNDCFVEPPTFTDSDNRYETVVKRRKIKVQRLTPAEALSIENPRLTVVEILPSKIRALIGKCDEIPDDHKQAVFREVMTDGSMNPAEERISDAAARLGIYSEEVVLIPQINEIKEKPGEQLLHMPLGEKESTVPPVSASKDAISVYTDAIGEEILKFLDTHIPKVGRGGS